MQDRREDAIHFALTHGLIKIQRDGRLVHTPLSLTPSCIATSALRELTALTPRFSQLMLKAGQDLDFLQTCLSSAALSDGFTRSLLSMALQVHNPQPLQLLLSRSDYLLTQSAADPEVIRPRQVEINMISNSFPFMSRQVFELHRYLYHDQETATHLVDHNPFDSTVDAMAAAIEHFGDSRAGLLMVVQPFEGNICDQRALEYRLLNRYGIRTVRCTLAEIGTTGELRQGHLTIKGLTVALAYFRAGYTPDDYDIPAAWAGRQLIERSSAIKCPTIGAQLAGAKKIQQVLTRPETIRRFVSDAEAQTLEAVFAGLYTLDEPLDDKPAYLQAMDQPDRFVLKPQREGGGNNLYDDAMVQRLASLTEDERQAYILMERLHSPAATAWLVVDGKMSSTRCVSEIGRYGACLADGGNILFNQDIGYLVRTKDEKVTEGGVSAGFACLNSLCRNG
jgi:glutathione synthase